MMAMVPPLSRPEDDIYVIKGIRVSLLLRHISSLSEDAEGLSYQLIGDVYLHGMMKGEVLLTSSEICELQLV